MKFIELTAVSIISASLGFYLAYESHTGLDKTRVQSSKGHKVQAVQEIKKNAKVKVIYKEIKSTVNPIHSFNNLSKLLYNLDQQDSFERSDQNQQGLLLAYSYLETLKDHEYMDLFHSLESFESQHLRGLIEKRLFKAWGSKNYQLALSFLKESYPNSFQSKLLEKQIITGLSKQSPLEAYEWFLQEQEAQEGQVGGWNGFLIDLFQTQSKLNINESLAKLDQVNGKENKLLALKGLLKGLDDSSQLPTLLEKYQGQEFISFRNRALKKWAELAPQESIEWAETNLEDSDKAKALRNISKAWLKQEPQQAANWILNNSDDHKQSYRIIVQNWDRKQLDNIDLWLESQGSQPAKDEAYKELVSKYLPTDYKKAINYSKLIQNKDLRQKVQEKIYKRLKWQNQSMAESARKSF